MKNWIDFLKFGIWRIQAKRLDKKKYFFISQLRIIILALRSFSEDKCILRASALTFYTLLSIVPVVAVAFGIAKGFEVEKLLERQLIQNFEGQEEVLYRIIEYSRNLLEATNGGLVAGFGIIMLLW
ncbi:MAG TPA: YhjD/YihY/BrkB family envelope integrity protein, partial [Victivallales bacterium]|nr:YhjD/YihY/BrkB family envelope integrity protein [Victivallales bacterium]